MLTLKRILSSELQSQIKAGLRNSELALTEKGKNELLEILAVEKQKELTSVANEIIAESENMKKLLNYGHQGDLNFRKIEKLPEGLKEYTDYDEKRGGYTLALGEHTGHAHTLLVDIENTQNVRILRDADGRFYLDISQELSLVHGTFVAPGKIDEREADKHDRIIFTPGIWKQDFEVEYDPFTREINRVKD